MDPADPPPLVPPVTESAGAPPAARGFRAVVAIVLGFLAVAILGVIIFYFAEQAWLQSWSRQTQVVPALPPVMGPPSQ
jgi:hypothetical protein